MSCKGIAPWKAVLLVIYCHGWEFEATVDRVRKVSAELCASAPGTLLDTLIKDLEARGMITVHGDRLVLTRKGLSNARKICMEHDDLCSKVGDAVWREVSKRFTTLKRFMRR